jgi:ribosome-associated heat shock protein Hsp15
MDDGAAGGAERQRIDKWLWHARVVKTRSLAQKLVVAGHVRANRERVAQSSDLVRRGDVLTVTLDRRVLVLRVQGFADRRGSAPEAQRLYEDMSPPPPPREAVAAPRAPGSGRPTKRERRQTDALGRDED